MESLAEMVDRKVHEAIVDVFRAAKGEPCLECDKRQELINLKDAEIAELKRELGRFHVSMIIELGRLNP